MGGGLPLSRLSFEDLSSHSSAISMGTAISGAKKFYVTTGRGFW
jgi:hypothetical protein